MTESADSLTAQIRRHWGCANVAPGCPAAEV